MFSSLELFASKKFVILISDQISSRNIAYTSALIGMQFGRKVPQMVGRNQKIPYGNDGLKSRTHLGITTQNLPVLNGLNFEKMRAIRSSLMSEKGLLVTSVTDNANYGKSSPTKIDSEHDNYWGIGVFGDAATINKHTQGLKLFGKQPKIPNSDTTSERRLVDSKNDLPVISLVLANNLSGGELANTSVILGVTYGKLYGDSIFEPDVEDHSGLNLGLPMVDITILNGHSFNNVKMRELRDKLHEDPELSVVDVTNATGKTRSYNDYLALAETTPILQTTYWGMGISGPSKLVAKYTEDLGSYITSAEEQASIKQQRR